MAYIRHDYYDLDLAASFDNLHQLSYNKANNKICIQNQMNTDSLCNYHMEYILTDAMLRDIYREDCREIIEFYHEHQHHIRYILSADASPSSQEIRRCFTCDDEIGIEQLMSHQRDN